MAKSKKERLRQAARQNFQTPHLKPAGAIAERGDPLEPVTLRLTLDQLTPYDRNPRQSKNDAWDAILNETRSLQGLDGVLAITRRPGETLYFPKRGGNTRLQVLRQLWEETGDESYYRVDCKIYPWVNEAEVLTAHLSDNDNRGGVNFIDRASAVRELKRELEKELGQSLSQRALAQQLTERGYAISYTILAYMEYAVDVLLPAIPRALASGMGKPRIIELRKIHFALREQWRKRSPDADVFEHLFLETLKESDDAALDLPEIEKRATERMLKALNTVAPMSEPDAGSSPPSAILQPAATTSENDKVRTKTSRASLHPEAHEKHGGDNSVVTETMPPVGTNDAPKKRPVKPAPPETYGAETGTASHPALSVLIDNTRNSGGIEQLRKTNFTLARTATRKTGIQKYIYPVDFAYGFVVDAPFRFLDPATVDPGEQTAMRTAQYLYHHLLALAENQTSADVVKAMPFHAEAIKHIQRGVETFNEKMRQFAPPPRPALAGACLFNAECYLGDEQLLALFQITINNRAIRRLGHDPFGAALFPPPPTDEQLGLDPAQFPELFQANSDS